MAVDNPLVEYMYKLLCVCLDHCTQNAIYQQFLWYCCRAALTIKKIPVHHRQVCLQSYCILWISSSLSATILSKQNALCRTSLIQARSNTQFPQPSLQTS